MKRFVKKLSNFAIISILCVSIYGCKEESSTSSEESYNGAGSRWVLKFKLNGIVNIKELNSNLDINATYTDLPSGFRKITVIASNDTSRVKIGDITYGVELPDYMFPFVAFDENVLIPTVVSGECPTNVNHNYVTSFAKSASRDDGEIASFNGWTPFGYWRYNENDNKTYINVYLRDGTLSDDSMSFNGSIADNCSNGEYYDPYGDPNDEYRAETTAYYTKSGGLIWHQKGLGNQVSNSHEINNRIENDFMLPYEPNLNQINQINGHYIGYAVIGNGQPTIGYKNIPINVDIEDGVLTLKEIKDINTGASNTTIATIKLYNEISGTKGLWSGDIQTDEGTEGIGCAIDLDASGSGKNAIICGGMNPDGTLKQLYSVILISE